MNEMAIYAKKMSICSAFDLSLLMLSCSNEYLFG